MQVSNRKLNDTLEKQIFSMFYQALADLQTPEEIEEVFSDLLTDTERTALAKRLAIATYLDKGRSYENIRDSLKVSSATIAAVAEQMGSPGMQLAIKKIKAEEWADEWSSKLSGLFRGIGSKS